MEMIIKKLVSSSLLLIIYFSTFFVYGKRDLICFNYDIIENELNFVRCNGSCLTIVRFDYNNNKITHHKIMPYKFKGFNDENIKLDCFPHKMDSVCKIYERLNIRIEIKYCNYELCNDDIYHSPKSCIDLKAIY